jgi:hypothetical protein
LVIKAVYEPIYSVSYTVTFAPGEHGTFQEQIVSGLHAGDPTPLAPFPTGQVGWRFAGWTPAIAPSVTASATYTATWERVLIPDIIPPGPSAPETPATQYPIIINLQPPEPITLPDNETTLSAPSASSSNAEGTSGTNSPSTTGQSGDQITSLPDNETPLASQDAANDKPQDRTILIILSSLLFLVVIVCIGLLFMRRQRR